MLFIGVDPSTDRFYWAEIRLDGGRFYYVTSGMTYRDSDWFKGEVGKRITNANLVAVEKPGGTLYGKVRYDNLVSLAVTAGVVYGFKRSVGGRAILVNAHGRGGWRPFLLKAGSGRRARGQEAMELELLLPRIVNGLPLRNGRLKGALSEHKRDALGIALWGALNIRKHLTQ